MDAPLQVNLFTGKRQVIWRTTAFRTVVETGLMIDRAFDERASWKLCNVCQ